MKGVEGQYADALNKRRSVLPVIIETMGSMSRHLQAHSATWRRAPSTKGPGAVDPRATASSAAARGASCGTTPNSWGDSEAILRKITTLKQRAFGAASAAAGGSVRGVGA